MSPDLLVVDAQIHEPSVSGDWSNASGQTRQAVLTEALLDHMDAVGVSAVVLHAGRERDWALRVAAEYPTRVACVFGTQSAFGHEPALAEQPDVEERVA